MINKAKVVIYKIINPVHTLYFQNSLDTIDVWN